MNEPMAARPSAAEIEALSPAAIGELWGWVDRQPEDGPAARCHAADVGTGARAEGTGDPRACHALGEVSHNADEVAALRALARRLKEARPTSRMPSLPRGEEGADDRTLTALERIDDLQRRMQAAQLQARLEHRLLKKHSPATDCGRRSAP